MKMRTIYLQGMILVAAIIALSGCGEKGELPLPADFVVLKFKNAEYKNFILGNYLDGEDSILVMRGNYCQEPIGEAGYSPYWELKDDWLLVDWKWHNFPYNAGLTLISEQTWDKLKGGTQPPFPKWSINEPHVKQPIAKIYYIHKSILSQYCHTDYTAIMREIEDEKQKLNDDCDCSVADKMDSWWAMVQKDLNSLIENDELETYYTEQEKK